jgi:hypothetical protein
VRALRVVLSSICCESNLGREIVVEKNVT